MKVKQNLLGIPTQAIFLMLTLMLIVLASAQLPLAFAEGRSGLIFLKDYKAASQMAIKNNKYLLVDVYTDWCGWCTKLDQDVFTEPKLVQYLQDNFVVVKLNPEISADNAEFADKYDVQSFPCAVVFDPAGKKLGKIRGYKEAPDYKQALEALVKGRTKTN